MFSKLFKRTTSDNNMEKKPQSWSTYLLYIVLAAFVAPYFFSNKNPDALFTIGNKSITKQDIQKFSVITMQSGLPKSFATISLIFAEEARLFNKSKYPFLPFYTPESIGLIALDAEVDSYIKNMPFAQKDQTFSLEQYQNLLKQTSMTEKMFENEVKKWIMIKQLLLLPETIITFLNSLQEFDTYAQQIWKAYLQFRYGEYVKITASFSPTFNDQELAELEQFYVTNQNLFKIPGNKSFYCLYFDDTSEERFKNIITDLQNGTSLEDISTKWNGDIVILNLDGNKAPEYSKGKHTLSDELITNLDNNIKETDLQTLMAIQDGKAKILYKLIKFTPSKPQDVSYFNTEVVKAWKAKDIKHKVISAWIEHKTLLLKIKAAANTFSTTKEKTEIKLMLKDLNANMKQNEQTEKEPMLKNHEIEIGKTLFTLSPGQLKTAIYDNEVYAVKLNKIKYNNEEMPEKFKQSVLNEIFFDLLHSYAEEILLKYNRRHSFLHSIMDF